MLVIKQACISFTFNAKNDYSNIIPIITSFLATIMDNIHCVDVVPYVVHAFILKSFLNTTEFCSSHIPAFLGSCGQHAGYRVPEQRGLKVLLKGPTVAAWWCRGLNLQPTNQ